MTLGLSAYTPLEALLLFQYLSVYGTQGAVFSKISDLLKNNPLVRSEPNFEPGRLSPDALRDVYLRLLKEEARKELNSAGANGADDSAGDHQGGSRKRKAPSPSLPSINDAIKHTHLIPQLVNKLYQNYREGAVREIREAEQRIQQLTIEVDSIKKGEWDKKLEDEIHQGKWNERLQRANNKKPQTNGVAAGPPERPTGTPSMVPRQDQIRQGQALQPSPSPPKARSPQPLRPPGYSHAQQQPPPTASVSPQPPQSVSSPYRVNSPALHQSPYTQHPPHVTQAPGSPAGAHPPLQSSTMYPPPAPSPTQYGPQFPPYPYGNNHARSPLPHSPYAGPSNQAPYMTPQGGYYPPHYPAQPGYPPQQQPHLPPSLGGRQLPPFQVTPQAPQTPQPQRQQQQQQQQVHAAPSPVPMPGRPPPQFATPVQRPDYGRQSLTALSNAQLLDVARLLQTPTPKRPATAIRPVMRTPWSRSSLSHPPLRPKSPTPPPVDVSPISDREPSPPPLSETATKRSTRQTRGRIATVPTAEPQMGRPTRASGRRGRGASAASSVVGSSARGRTRSQSIMSHASIDNESVTGRRVKAEPATPAEIPDAVHSTVENTPTSSQRPPPTLNVNKRKRSLRGTSEASDTPTAYRRTSPAARKDMVLAVRNFPRLSQSVMENILSHKHASLFANPVREKDAEGYKDIIRAAQDLKSIKAAIGAGARAVNAATADMTPGGSSSREASTILLPVSEDIVPPKGIVNSAQLEKEVMRMFANAVMFNPGEDDVVRDAREMFESAAVSLATFRSAERTSTGGHNDGAVGRTRRAESEVDELTVDEPEDGIGGAGTGPVATKPKRGA